MHRLDRARGALLGTFVGDALGMPYEGASPDAVVDRPDMEHARLGRGTYTDDTQMMIALAESLAERREVDEEALGAAFLAAYDPARGYGAGTRAVLALIEAGRDPLEAASQIFDGQGSLGNGAAMRIAPVAVAFADDPALVRSEAERSARVTHAHAFGIDSAVAQAAAVAAALRGEDALEAAHAAASTAELRHRLDAVAALLAGGGATVAHRATQRAREPAVSPKRAAGALGSSSAGHESVPLAIYAALAHDDFEEALVYAVRCGGDTDTIAAMAGAIAGARHGATAIPERWLEALEEGPKGRSHVEALAERLATR